MKFSELKAELDQEIKRNVYIFTGPEKEVMKKYINRISVNIPEGTHSTVNKASSFTEIIPKLSTRNLFSSKQVFLIEDDKSVTEFGYDELKKLVGENTVILTFKEIDKRKKLFKQAKDDIVEFKRFNENDLIWFVQKIIDVSDNLAVLIARYCGNDVARIENECHKLSCLGTEITEETVKELIHPPLEDRIFDMVDFVAKKKRNEVFALYYDLIELKTSPLQIIGLLYSKFKQLFLVQNYLSLPNAEIAGKTGMTFFQVNSARSLVGMFTVEELLAVMRKVQQTEVGIKTGEVDQFIGMESLLVDILE